MSSAIELRIDPRERTVGAGRVRRLLPYRERRMVGPFIFADVLGPEELTAETPININAHPHIGLSTVTYLFDGRMVHRDSTGAVQTVTPGAVNWMTAGSGVTHTERSHPDDLAGPHPIHGLQTWVALPSDFEGAAPSFQHAAASEIPVTTVGSSSVRVAVGSGWSVDSPIRTSSPLLLAEVRLHSESPVPIVCPLPELAVLCLSGDVRINGERLASGQMVVLRRGIRSSLNGSGDAVVLGGEPVGKRHIWWNFVHSDPDRIEDAKADWLEQRFPLVDNDHDPYVPLPA